MKHMEINDAETFYRTFADLLASGAEDKRIARKLGSSRGEIKRRRLLFTQEGIVTAESVDTEKLDAWLASNAGVRAQSQWDTHHRQQQAMGATGTKPQKGYKMPDVKRARLKQKV